MGRTAEVAEDAEEVMLAGDERHQQLEQLRREIQVGLDHYRVSRSTVTIVRVIHGARDPGELFKD